MNNKKMIIEKEENDEMIRKLNLLSRAADVAIRKERDMKEGA